MPEDGNDLWQIKYLTELLILEVINKRKNPAKGTNQQGKEWALCSLVSSYLDKMSVWKFSLV